MIRAAAFAAALAVAACGGGSVDRGIFSLSGEVQTDAIVACKNERGIPGNFTTSVFEYGSGAREVLIAPEFAVTLEDARAINACAQAKLGALVAGGGAITPAAAPAPSSAVQPAPAVQAAPTTGFAPMAGCRPGGGVFQGGAAICPGQ